MDTDMQGNVIELQKNKPIENLDTGGFKMMHFYSNNIVYPVITLVHQYA